MDLITELKATFKNGSIITRLVYVNLAIFLIVRIAYAILYLLNIDPMIVQWLSLPSDLGTLATRPWTLLTYMFFHFEFFHLLFNLLWLYWFGKIFLNYFNEQQLLSTYIIGGFVGGILYLVAFNTLPVFQNDSAGLLMGASAGIIAIVISAALYAPNVQINLLLISQFTGPIKIIWIAVFSIFSYLIALNSTNAGGNLAHLGGVLWGYLFVSQIKKGTDISDWLKKIIIQIQALFKQKSKLKVAYRKSKPAQKMDDREYNKTKKEEKENINIILDKIRKSGYDSLSKKEKEILFKMGSNNGKPN